MDGMGLANQSDPYVKVSLNLKPTFHPLLGYLWTENTYVKVSHNFCCQVICGEKMAKTEVVKEEPEYPKFNEASSTFTFPVRSHNFFFGPAIFFACFSLGYFAFANFAVLTKIGRRNNINTGEIKFKGNFQIYLN